MFLKSKDTEEYLGLDLALDLTFQRGGIINWEQKEDWVWSREPAEMGKPGR